MAVTAGCRGDRVGPTRSARHDDVSDPAVAYANRRAGGDVYREGYVDAENYRLHYVEAGPEQGELVFFYHGFPSFWLCFRPQMEALRRRYRVVAVDALGAGLSDKPDDLAAYKVEALAAQLDAVARHLNGDQQFHLIGHDWGAALAWAYAAAYGERLRSVIGMSAPSYNALLELLETNEKQRLRSEYMQHFRATTAAEIRADPPGETLWARSYDRLLARGDLSAEEGALFRQALAPAAASNGGYNWYRANIPPFDEIDESDYWPARGSVIEPPALLLWGEEDQIFESQFLDIMKRDCRALDIKILPKINHWTSMQAPDNATARIVDFLQSIDG
ncbi:MAG: alpha/beta hydrolase [Pseudomonadota bacterium]